MQTNQKKTAEQTQEKNLLGQLWFKYFPYWPLFLSFLILSCAGAWYKLRNTIPLYEATASILIKDEKKGEDQEKMIETLNQLSTKKIIENEIEVIKSRALMNQVVKNLHLYAPVYEKGKNNPISAYKTSPVSIEARNPDSITQIGNVFFTVDSAKTKVIIGDKSYTLNEWISTPYGVIKFIPQKNVQPNKDPLYFNFVEPKMVASYLISALGVSTVSKLSSVISLKFLDESPRKAEDILNELMLVYSRAALNDKNTLASNTLSFVEERLKHVAKDLDSIEKKSQQYKASQGAIDISSQGSLYLENVSTLSQKMAEVNVQMDVLNQVESYVQSKENDNKGSITPSTIGVDDPLLTELLNKLYTAELEYDKLRKTTALNNPIALSLKEQIDKLRPSILENIRSRKSGIAASRNNLGALNNRFSGMLSSIPKKERDLLEISRDQNIKSGIYNFLLQKREETTLALSSSIADSRIIDKAQASYGPVSPNRKKYYMMAVVLAFGLAVGLVTANEMLKRTILYRHEIENFTNIPIIGEIVHEKSNEPIVIGDGKRTFIAEQFRNLRASLPYLGINADRKKLLVTSTISGEGKSFVVANLGISLAMTGKKVLVIEFDLSDPTLGEKLGIVSEKGLTDYLRGDIKKEEIIQQTSIHESLFIAPAGKLPDNPSELIMSEKVPELLNYFSSKFDLIIIDTAPVGLLSDAYVLSAYCDATLYVVRHRHTPKVSIQRIDENNKINQLKNMGIVFNGIRSRGFGKNGYGYGYGYGYIQKEKRSRKKGVPRKVA